MKQNQRDLMVTLVQAAAKKWPSFNVVPVTDATGVVQAKVSDPNNNASYIAALYELGARGATPLGRWKGEDNILVGKVGEGVATTKVEVPGPVVKLQSAGAAMKITPAKAPFVPKEPVPMVKVVPKPKPKR